MLGKQVPQMFLNPMVRNHQATVTALSVSRNLAHHLHFHIFAPCCFRLSRIVSRTKAGLLSPPSELQGLLGERRMRVAWSRGHAADPSQPGPALSRGQGPVLARTSAAADASRGLRAQAGPVHVSHGRSFWGRAAWGAYLSDPISCSSCCPGAGGGLPGAGARGL